MKRASRIALVTVATAASALATPALSAAEAPGAPQPPAQRPAEPYVKSSEPGPQTGAQPRLNVIKAPVATVDRTSGIITLQPRPDARPLVVQFAPTTVKDLKPGDGIVLRLTYSMGEPTKLGNERAGDAPAKAEGEAVTMNEIEAEMGQAIVTGSVSNLDPNTGELDLRTDRTVPLHLQFTPAAVAQLKNGQTITVDMGFKREAPAPEPVG